MLANTRGFVGQVVAGRLRLQRVSVDSGGVRTYRCSLDVGTRKTWYVKVAGQRSRKRLSSEAEMFRWLRGRLPVPRSRFASSPVIAVLVTAHTGDIAGQRIGDHLGAAALVETLVDVVGRIQALAGAGIPPVPPNRASSLIRPVSRASLHPDHRRLDDDALRQRLLVPCGSTRVVTHGDLFLTNLAFASTGELAGVLDVGQMHLGCRYMDIALLSWSVEMLVGREAADEFLQRFALHAAHPEILHHRLRYDLSLASPEPWAWLARYFPTYVSREV